MLLSVESNNSDSKKDHIAIQIVCFLAIYFSWGFIDTRGAIHDKTTLTNSGVIIFTALGYFITSSIIGILLRIFNNPYTYSIYWIPFWIANFIHPSAWLVFINISHIDVSISLPLYSLSFMIPTIWGLTFMGDNASDIKISSIVLSFSAIIILIISSYFQLREDKKIKSPQVINIETVHIETETETKTETEYKSITNVSEV